MNFEPRHRDHWQQAVMPVSLKGEWGNIDSYCYVISKTFAPFEDDDDDPIHLVKVGMSRFETADSSYKGLNRIAGLKTALIELKVWRIYLYDHFDTNDKSTRAFQAEQRMHSAIEDQYPKVRIKFKGFSSVRDLNPNTEWFAIPKKDMPTFLKWLDEEVFYKISPVAIYGTAFTSRTSNPIEVDKSRSASSQVEITSVSGNTRSKSGAINQFTSRYAKSKRQKEAELAADERKKNQLREHRELTAKYKKTPEFFQKLFVNQRFVDSELDGKKYEKKIITDVDYFKTPEGENYKHMKVLYEPAPRPRGQKMLTDKEKDKYGGLMTIPEVFVYFPKLKKKYEDIFDWYVVAERLNEEKLYSNND